MGGPATGTYTLVTGNDKQYLRIVNDNKDECIDGLMIWKEPWLALHQL